MWPWNQQSKQISRKRAKQLPGQVMTNVNNWSVYDNLYQNYKPKTSDSQNIEKQKKKTLCQIKQLTNELSINTKKLLIFRDNC